MATSLTGPIIGELGTEGAIVSALRTSVEPFVADARGYDTVLLSWAPTAPSTWTGLKVVRSRSGFPRSWDDGVGVTEITTANWYEESGTEVTNLTGGWHYFSLFLRDAFGWQRVARADALIPYDYGSTDTLWDTIPEYYKYIKDNSAAPSLTNLRINPALYQTQDGENTPPNLLLSSFLNLFGWGLDLLRTEAEGVLGGYDVTALHAKRVELLSLQFGQEVEKVVPAHVSRTAVRNLASIYRKRGTMSGIKDLVTMVTGWEVEVSLGPNIMLSEEQASMSLTPEVLDWDASKQYAVGQRVKYNTRIFQALVTTRGTAQAPPSSATSNTWWSYVAYPRLDRTTVRSTTNDVATWQVRLNGTTPVNGNTGVGVGTPDPLDLSDLTNNALQVYTTTAATTMDVVSIPLKYNGVAQVTPTPREYILENGIALPTPATWSASKSYRYGDQALYKGALYAAINDTTSVPTVTTEWARIGHDDRPRLTVSYYAHGPFSGTAGSGGKRNYPIFEEYSANGTLIRKVIASPGTYPAIQFFDPMVDDYLDLDYRPAATGQSWSATGSGFWPVTMADDGGQVSPPTDAGRSARLRIATGLPTNGRIAVTWTSDPGTTRLRGIVFRQSNPTNFWIATQTGLFKVVAGAARANPASGALSWTKFTKGERMMVNLSGDVISVYRNGTLLGSATDSFNNTATSHGLGQEA